MYVKFKAKPHNLSLIVAYAPTSAANEDELNQFYEMIQEAVDSIPSRDILMVLGDFNGKVGKATLPTPVHGKFGLGERNER